MEKEPSLSSAPGRKPNRRSKIVAFLIENEKNFGTPEYLSPREVAAQIKVSPATIHSYRTRLGFTKATGEVMQNILVTNYPQYSNERDTVQDLKEEGIIGPMERLKVLSRLIRTGAPLIKINAIKAIEELSRTSEGRVGPPSPMTPEERQARLARLMLAVGRADVDAAYNAAFTPTTEELQERASEAPLQPNSGDLPLNVPISGGSMRDLPESTSSPGS